MSQNLFGSNVFNVFSMLFAMVTKYKITVNSIKVTAGLIIAF